MTGCCAWISARNTLSAGNGYARSPATPAMALHARLSTKRYSMRTRIAILLPGGLVGVRGAGVVTLSGCRGDLGGPRRRLLRAPRHELPILRDRGLEFGFSSFSPSN
jgi:hypothetical protein